MTKNTRFSPEVRQRAVRMVLESCQGEYDSHWLQFVPLPQRLAVYRLRKSWKNRAEVELTTLTCVDWYNNRRLLERLSHIPTAEAEKAYYASIGNDELAA